MRDQEKFAKPPLCAQPGWCWSISIKSLDHPGASRHPSFRRGVRAHFSHLRLLTFSSKEPGGTGSGEIPGPLLVHRRNHLRY
jgi:hypothetical protein